MTEGAVLTICLLVLAIGSAFVGYRLGRETMKEKITNEIQAYYKKRKEKVKKSIQNENIKQALVYMVEDEEKEILSNIDLD